MILTVTLNPLLEYRYSYKSVSIGGNNRNPVQQLQAGGKGINVSRQLKHFGVESLNFTLLGGDNGKRIADCLRTEGLSFTSVKTKSGSRNASVIIEENTRRVTTYFGNNSLVSEIEVEEFKLKLEKMIQNCEIVVFSGSSPCKETDSVFPFGIETANKYDKISLLDTYGNHLSSCLECSPTLIHNNLEEIASSLEIPLDRESEILDFLLNIYSKGTKQIYLTNGSKPTYVANFDYHYKVENPEIKCIDSTGSGDAFAAGIIFGHYKDMVFDEFLPLATALGTLNASRSDVCNVNPEHAVRMAKDVKVIPVGKKMKLVDVTPQK
ncbi:MAG: 1-phosphofructokinase family hexose kinase [Ignavibacteriaceae bacterium]